MRLNELLMRLTVFISQIASLFSRKDRLHHARFAHPHELTPLISPALKEGQESSLLLGTSVFNHILRVSQSHERPELGNMLIAARTRGGKGLLAVSQLLSWRHSVIVNDIKGELFTQTAGYRSKLGPVFVIDPQGYGHQFDPTLGKRTDLELKSIAKNLLFKPNEGEGEVFTERAIRMLTPLFHAAILEKTPLLQYTAYMINQPIQYVAERIDTISLLNNISPSLSTRFLDGRIEETDFQNKFLLSAWGTLTARLDSLLAESVVQCLSGNDFTVKDLMCGRAPITVYLRWSEADLLVLSPVIRLLWTSLIDALLKTYDSRNGKTCHPVLLLIDEAGKTGVPYLADHASTVVGRRISLWIAVQDLSQLEKIYGVHGAKTLRNNCDTQIYYRPNDKDTAEYLESCLGKKSDYAQSHTSRDGKELSQGQSEQGVPLLSAWDIKQMQDEDILGFHRNLPPFRGKRMDWRHFPILRQRREIPPPRLPNLPPLEKILMEGQGRTQSDATPWQLDSGLIRRERSVTSQPNGLKKVF